MSNSANLAGLMADESIGAGQKKKGFFEEKQEQWNNSMPGTITNSVGKWLGDVPWMKCISLAVIAGMAGSYAWDAVKKNNQKKVFEEIFAGTKDNTSNYSKDFLLKNINESPKQVQDVMRKEILSLPANKGVVTVDPKTGAEIVAPEKLKITQLETATLSEKLQKLNKEARYTTEESSSKNPALGKP